MQAGCMFENAAEMGKACSKCDVHNKCCVVPSFDLCVTGTACKDFSKCNNNNNRVKMDVLSMTESPGGSAQTFWGVANCVEKHNVQIILLEISDTLATAFGRASDQPSYCKRIVDIYEKMGLASLIFVNSTLHFLAYHKKGAGST